MTPTTHYKPMYGGVITTPPPNPPPFSLALLPSLTTSFQTFILWGKKSTSLYFASLVLGTCSLKARAMSDEVWYLTRQYLPRNTIWDY